jgi:transposase
MVQFRRMITSFDEVAADLLTEILGLCQAYID